MSLLVILQVLAFIFALSAYYTTDRKLFLKINATAIFFIGISFYIQGGMTGFYIELMMFSIHIASLFVSKTQEKYLKLIAPPVAFYLANSIYDNGQSSFMAIAITFFVIGVFQHNMIYNKFMFIIGLVFMFFYSMSLEVPIIAASNIVGILVLIVSLLNINKENEDKKSNKEKLP